MIDLSSIFQWFVITNVLLICMWCLFCIIYPVLHKTRFRPTHKSLLFATRCLFAFILIVPMFTRFYTPQDKIELLLSVNEQILSIRETVFQHAYLDANPKPASNKPVQQALFPVNSVKSFLLYIVLTCFLLRIAMVTRSLGRLSWLVKAGYRWKKNGKLRIIISDHICVPFSTLALGRFHIVIPTSMLTNPKDLKMAIKHEGTHHRHGDTLWLLIMEIVKLLFFVNPFVFLWTRTFETLQENACDEVLISQPSISLRSYCDCLIRLSKSIADFNPNMIAVSSIVKIPAISLNRNSRLTRRIKMMSQQKLIRFSVLKLLIIAVPMLLTAFSLPFFLKGSLFAEIRIKPGTQQKVPVSESLSTSKRDYKKVIPSMLPTKGFLSSGFGYRKDPFTGETKFHPGIDIANTTGTPIVTPEDGIVVFAERKGNFGLLLTIDHGENVTTRYAQLSKILFKVGSTVTKGQKVALMGSSGRSTAPHLHYELIIDGKKVDPLKYLKK